MKIDPGVRRIAIASTLSLLLLSGFAKVNALRSQMVGLELGISAQYKNNQNQLSAYALAYSEQVSIADRQSDQQRRILADLEAERLRRVLTEAIKGSYDGKVDKAGQPVLFSAIKEAYPKVDLASYNKILLFVQANREAFRSQQQILLDKIRNYKRFSEGDIINSFIIHQLGFPSNHLTAEIGDQKLFGAAALNQIEQIVTDDTTRAAFASGSMKPLTPSGAPTGRGD
jgi:hypothetical protein